LAALSPLTQVHSPCWAKRKVKLKVKVRENKNFPREKNRDLTIIFEMRRKQCSANLFAEMMVLNMARIFHEPILLLPPITLSIHFDSMQRRVIPSSFFVIGRISLKNSRQQSLNTSLN
jgi:hypothetical protein